MKTIILIIGLMLLPACDYLLQEKEIEVGTIENYDFENDIPEFKTVEGAFYWLNTNRQYDYTVASDYVQTPKETYYKINTDTGKMLGDCKAFSLFFSYILDANFGIYSEIVFYKNGNNNHVVTYVPSMKKYYDPTCNSEYDTIKKEIIDIIPYSQAIWMAVNYHGIL